MPGKEIIRAIYGGLRYPVRLCVLGLAVFVYSHPGLAAGILFGDEPIPSTDMKKTEQWTEMRNRFADQINSAEKAACGSEVYSVAGKPRAVDFCKVSAWKSLIRKLKFERFSPRMLSEINRFFNRYKYVEDETNYAVSDYWATPYEFLNFSGDCEDYAIAKYYTLRALGMDANSLKIVTVLDLNLKVGHAILTVDLDNKTYVLDNQFDKVAVASKIKTYRAIYSMNEERSWKYVRPTPEALMHSAMR